MAEALQAQAKRVGKERLGIELVLKPYCLPGEFKPTRGTKLYLGDKILGDVTLTGGEEFVRSVKDGHVGTLRQDIKDGPLWLRNYILVNLNGEVALRLDSAIKVDVTDKFYHGILMEYAELMGIHGGNRI